MDKHSKIYIAGHSGMVGSAIMRVLKTQGFTNIISKTRRELDLLNFDHVNQFFEENKPEYVFMCAAKVGGIAANIANPAVFLYENLSIQNNVIHCSHLHGVIKIAFLGSSCIYPRHCEQPMKEDYLLSGKLEPTNEGYAIAKIAGIKMIEFYHQQYGTLGIAPIPCNLYGTNDSFDPKNSHVLSSLVRKFIDAVDSDAKEVTIWGTGQARREFMHVDDSARAIIYLMENWDLPNIINIGWGIDYSIKELAELIADKTEFKGNIIWDKTKPEGMPRKCMDVSQMKRIGFQPRITIEQGILQTIAEYKNLKANYLI